MNKEAERTPQQQKQPDHAGSAKTSDVQANPSQGNQSQGNPRQQESSKKNPATDNNPQHKDQPKPEDAKRHAS